MMVYWEDLTNAETAGVLGCSVAAVRLRLFRARERLRAQLRIAENKAQNIRGNHHE